jgi:hypothetical protein
MGSFFPVRPLTKEVFGPDGSRVFHSRIEQIYMEGQSGKELCLAPNDLNEAFVHPTLLQVEKLPKEFQATFDWVELRLVNDKIEMRPRGKFDKEPKADAPVVIAEPVELVTVPLEIITHMHHLCAWEHQHCDEGERCTGAKGNELDEQRSVFYVDETQMLSRDQAKMVCGKCWDRLVSANPEMLQWSHVDTRKLPPHATVNVYK